MQINNRSIQDMDLFEDPLCVPIIVVEHMTSILRSASVNSYFSPFGTRRKLPVENESRTIIKFSANSPQQKQRVLRLVVFVHGFQACSIFLNLSLSVISAINCIF